MKLHINRTFALVALGILLLVLILRWQGCITLGPPATGSGSPPDTVTTVVHDTVTRYVDREKVVTRWLPAPPPDTVTVPDTSSPYAATDSTCPCDSVRTYTVTYTDSTNPVDTNINYWRSKLRVHGFLLDLQHQYQLAPERQQQITTTITRDIHHHLSALYITGGAQFTPTEWKLGAEYVHRNFSIGLQRNFTMQTFEAQAGIPIITFGRKR